MPLSPNHELMAQKRYMNNHHNPYRSVDNTSAASPAAGVFHKDGAAGAGMVYLAAAGAGSAIINGSI